MTSSCQLLLVAGHFAPIIDMRRFTASKYLLKDPKAHGCKYTLYVGAVVCQHCGLKFKRDSDAYTQHTATCLADSPTFTTTPKKGSTYSFVNFENAVPSPYTLVADIESENIDIKRVCGFCDAKLYYLNDKNEMKKVLKSCTHPKEAFRSCDLCTLKILRLRKEAISACRKQHHVIMKEGAGVCGDCEKKLSQKEDAIVHDSTHVLPCSVCPTEDAQYCIHSAAQKMRCLIPLIYRAFSK